ncbi:MAG: penicillin-binding protein 2 [Patescibacteria group bacterium]|nr:penicillin-binding protein 2 [Patescibacteria group bacterium]
MEIQSTQAEQKNRISFVSSAFLLLFIALVGMLVQRQVFEHWHFAALAQEQHMTSQVVPAQRGKILVEEKGGEELYPLATNVTLFALSAVPSQISRPELTATKLMPFLEGIEESELIEKLDSNAMYLPPLKRKITEQEAQQILDLDLDGIFLVPEKYRYFPEETMAAHLLGFVNRDGVGQYGLEGYFNDELGGESGFLEAEQDSFGQQIALGVRQSVDPKDGLDVVVTIDRAVQYYVEKELKAQVEATKATGGDVIVMDPKTGKIIAMASYPTFNPNNYNTEPIENFTNPNVSKVYEPGSVFKVLTMAAGIDAGLVSPSTVYTDTGEITLNEETIRNSDLAAHGQQTMTQVLEKSLNTGAVYVVQKLGRGLFNKYLRNFGFYEPTKVEMSGEVGGHIRALRQWADIDLATMSFGQGIAITPMQLITAMSALVNDGRMMQPHIIDKILYPSGAVSIDPVMTAQVVSPQTAQQIAAMMVSVVENGNHATKARIQGYHIGGKTGTAQVPDPVTGAYLEGVGSTIGTFVGFGPAEDPKFTVLVRIDRPTTVQYAESSAVPLFGKIAKFLLDYWHVPTTY